MSKAILRMRNFPLPPAGYGRMGEGQGERAVMFQAIGQTPFHVSLPSVVRNFTEFLRPIPFCLACFLL